MSLTSYTTGQEMHRPMLGVWAGFIIIIIGLLALDLGVFHKKDEVMSPRQALLWSGIWFAVSCCFCVFVFFAYQNHWWQLNLAGTEPDGWNAVMLYFTGYLVEESLSADNVFVIAMIMASFRVPAEMQHRVLFWGIFGALVMRGAMIASGAALVQQFHWVLYLFGALLLLSAVRLIITKESEEGNATLDKITGFLEKYLPVTNTMDGGKFLTRVDGRLMFTRLALALIVVEVSDLIFAIDSIPAIFAITEEPFIIFTSNVFAILGLRSLYFALAGCIQQFHYLKHALSVLLFVIGLKMIFKDSLHAIPNLTVYTLSLVVLILGAGIIASIVRSRRLASQGITCPPRETVGSSK